MSDQNIKKVLLKLTLPLEKNYIISNLLKTNYEEGEKIINKLLEENRIIEVKKDFYKIK